MDMAIEAGGRKLAAHVTRPVHAAAGPRPALVLCHGFPAGPGGALTSAQTYPDLADHLAAETGWTVIAFNFGGAGESEGAFSLSAWLDDLRAVVDYAVDLPRAGGAWVAGSSAGGAIALCAAAEDDRILGVATLAAPADFDNWANDARSFLAYCRVVGVIRDAAFPPDFEAWAGEFKRVQPLAAAAAVPPRPLLLVHGSDDPVVPVSDARVLADAASGQADLRVIAGAGHRLRHDPRAVAALIGWMERQGVG
ncbi:MAG: alpha/beta fold hydrolase [Acidimicrobiia bacterium]|nr:alpha/beta fold hydrolase [Acidimicrobiia bacterium]